MILQVLNNLDKFLGIILIFILGIEFSSFEIFQNSIKVMDEIPNVEGFSQYLHSSADFFPNPYSQFSQTTPPLWLSEIVKWRTTNQISDKEFFDNIKYMIKIGKIPITQHDLALTDIENNLYLENLLDDLDVQLFSFDNGFNFVAAADIGSTKNSMQTIDTIYKVEPEVILFAGDLSYKNPREWFGLTDFLGLDRINIAFGNHDIIYKEDYKMHYNIPNYYSFDKKNIHFISLSTEDPYQKDSKQFMFLKNDLKLNNENSNTEWIVVFFHRPMYSDGGRNEIELRNSFQPLFDLYGVDLVIQGHNHLYERTKPLMFNGMVTDNSTCYYDDPQGQIFITVGNGGRNHHSFYEKSDWSIIQNDKDFGILNMRLSEDGKILAGELINNNGYVSDFFVISKSKNTLEQGELDNCKLNQ